METIILSAAGFLLVGLLAIAAGESLRRRRVRRISNLILVNTRCWTYGPDGRVICQ